MKKNSLSVEQELNRLRRNKLVLWVGILFLAAVLLWIAFSLLGSQHQVKIDQQLTELAKPLVPRLSAEVFEQIQGERYLNDEELSYFPIYVYYAENEKALAVLTDIMADNLEPTVASEPEAGVELIEETASASSTVNVASEGAGLTDAQE